MPRTARTSAKSRVRRISLPGILYDLARQRSAEFLYTAISPFGLELICFDLRLRVPHEVTLCIARTPEKVQASVDRLIARHFQQSIERNGILIQAVHGRREPALQPAPTGDFTRARDYIRYSDTLADCIEARWRELGYASFSAYVTAVLRYDLLLLGPHNYFNGDDVDPELLASLDRETRREFEENRQPKRIYLDRALTLAAGRDLTREELSARKLELGELIIQWALKADREDRGR
jgi:hypothetical protein